MIKKKKNYTGNFFMRSQLANYRWRREEVGEKMFEE